MSQQIQSYGQSPYAEEALRLAEIGRGQEGMARTAAPVGPNLADGGGMSKPNVNTQPYNNTRLMEQNMGLEHSRVPFLDNKPMLLDKFAKEVWTFLKKSTKRTNLRILAMLRCCTPTMAVTLLSRWASLK